MGPVKIRAATERRLLRWQHLGLLAALLAGGAGAATHAWHETPALSAQSDALPAAEFARMVREFSEDDGFFRSDNFVSNETSYLHILDKLRENDATGGAYIGVGPEQNFTYIAKIRPRVAFIVDIRRQAIVQHLMFKALFEVSETRAEFLSRLLSKPLSGERAPGTATAVEPMLAYFAETPTEPMTFAATLAALRGTIRDTFQVTLSSRDQAVLEYVFNAFREESLEIRYRSGGTHGGIPQWGRFPSLRDLVLEPDLHGRLGNFLVDEDDYRFVRDLQRRNRVIPVVGDFGGSRALAAIGDYLRRSGCAVTAFYTSNVEQYLFASGSFDAFVANVRKLPIADNSLFIRAFPNLRDQHPARVRGHRLTTLLQKMRVFLDDSDQGLYGDYWKLVITHYIPADQP